MGMRLFRGFIVVMIASVVVWWLNIPFLDSERDESLTVVTSTPMIKDMVHKLMGPDVNVVSLTFTGSNPKAQAIDPDRLSELTRAAVVIINGNGYDDQFLDSAPTFNAKLIDLSKQLGRASAKLDTYYWMNPYEYITTIEFLTVTLTRLFPDRRSEINYRKFAYVDSIYALTQNVRDQMELIKTDQPVLASNHASFNSFANAFGFKTIIIDLSEPLNETTLTDTIDKLKQHNIKVLYPVEGVEIQGMDLLLEVALAQGWQLQLANPIMTLNLDGANSGVNTYVELLEYNFRTLSDG